MHVEVFGHLLDVLVLGDMYALFGVRYAPVEVTFRVPQALDCVLDSEHLVELIIEGRGCRCCQEVIHADSNEDVACFASLVEYGWIGLGLLVPVSFEVGV